MLAQRIHSEEFVFIKDGLQLNLTRIVYLNVCRVHRIIKMSDDEVMKFEITDEDLNNEFNYDLKRPRMSKNRATYGIWAEDSDGDDDPGKQLINLKMGINFFDVTFFLVIVLNSHLLYSRVLTPSCFLQFVHRTFQK